MARVRFVNNCPDDRWPEERNDCLVRAATLVVDRPYAEVHELFAKHGRLPARGAYLSTTIPAMAELGMRMVELKYRMTSTVRRDTVFETRAGGYGERRGGCAYIRRYEHTIASFIKAHPVGRFLVLVTGHAVAVIDGVVHDLDTRFRGRRYVEAYFTFAEKQQTRGAGPCTGAG